MNTNCYCGHPKERHRYETETIIKYGMGKCIHCVCKDYAPAEEERSRQEEEEWEKRKIAIFAVREFCEELLEKHIQGTELRAFIRGRLEALQALTPTKQ